jgi:hypothetical protein
MTSEPALWTPGSPLLPTNRNILAGNGNLIEAPIWRLGKGTARPKNKDGSVDLALYTITRHYERRGPKGETIQQELTIVSNPHFGFPTVLGFRIICSLLHELARLNYPGPRIACTRAKLCQWLDAPFNGKYYGLIVDQLKAMMNTTLAFRDSWYVIEKGKRTGSMFPGVRNIQIVANFQFQADAPRSQRARQRSLGLNYDEWVELGQDFYENAVAYAVPLDLPYMNGLHDSTAQRLYSYFEKRNYGKPMYREALRKLAMRLPLAKTAPSAIKAEIKPALDELKSPNKYGKRLLSDWCIVAAGAKGPDGRLCQAVTLYVWFARAVGVGVVASLRARFAGQKQPELVLDEHFADDASSAGDDNDKTTAPF